MFPSLAFGKNFPSFALKFFALAHSKSEIPACARYIYDVLQRNCYYFRIRIRTQYAAMKYARALQTILRRRPSKAAFSSYFAKRRRSHPRLASSISILRASSTIQGAALPPLGKCRPVRAAPPAPPYFRHCEPSNICTRTWG